MTLIALDQIEVKDRLRQIDSAHVEAIAASMRERGLITPIKVRPMDGGAYRLVAGAHRYAAAQTLEWEKLDATISSLNDAEARIEEIDENVFRHELNPFDRAVFLTERKRLYEELHPEARAGGDRRSDQMAKIAIWSFAEATAERTNLKPRTIRRAVSIVTRLTEDTKQRIAGTWIAQKEGQLHALAQLGDKDQARVLDLMLEGKAKKVTAALDIVRGKNTQSAPDEKQYRKLLDAWTRAGMTARCRFVEAVGDDLATLLADLDEAA